jgi:predicted NUDIX family NTP pyrophosphohydrolase
MAAQSAGILLYRRHNNEWEYFLVHPGGPFFARRQDGLWSIPKGEIVSHEEPEATALRELEEETGYVFTGALIRLQPIRQKGGKKVIAFAGEGDMDAAAIVCNNFEMEWPPRSGKFRSFPEVDKAGWFTYATAAIKILPAQLPLLDELQAYLTGKN